MNTEYISAEAWGQFQEQYPGAHAALRFLALLGEAAWLEQHGKMSWEKARLAELQEQLWDCRLVVVG